MYREGGGGGGGGAGGRGEGRGGNILSYSLGKKGVWKEEKKHPINKYCKAVCRTAPGTLCLSNMNL